MTAPTKPLLPNKYKIENDNEVVRRLDSVFFTEIYELSNGKFLFLFKNEIYEDYFSNFGQYKPILVNNKNYVSLVSDQYSREILKDVIGEINSIKVKNDTTPHGFDRVAGMNDLKQLFVREVIEPIKNPERYKEFKIPIPNGILLFGPPGCGKTFLVKMLAEEIGYYHLEIKHSDIASPYIHETVRKISEIFEKARIHAPTLLFIDELEGLVPSRENVSGGMPQKNEEINEFLIQLNDIGKNNVLVVGATNRPNLIDSAILRSGRMDKRIFVPPPDFDARKELFKLYLTGRPHSTDIDYDQLAKMTDGFTCSDIELLVTDAARMTINNNKSLIDEETLSLVILRSQPSISKEDIERFRQFADIERW